MERLVSHESHKLICWFPAGELTPEDILNYFPKMNSCPGGQEANRFGNFSRVENFGLDDSKMRSLVMVRQSNLKDQTEIKVGIDCPSEGGYALSRMVQMLLDGFGMTTFISRELKSVAQFLVVSPTFLDKSTTFYTLLPD